MARPLRIEFPGALYHVTARGNERKRIVFDDEDREGWVDTLARAVRRYEWQVHAWCLMDNHHHLLLETPRPNLASGMRELNGTYAQSFNRRYGRWGHLLGGRYWSILVQREPHLLELCRYVVLNPIRAGAPPSSLPAYRWSSFRATAGLEPAPDYLVTGWTLGRFGTIAKRAQEAYRRFVAGGLGADPWRELQAGMYLGDDDFVRAHQPRSLADPEITFEQREPIRASLEELLAGDRRRAILEAHRDHGYRLREIAAAVGVHYSSVSRWLREIERGLDGASP
jgi:putative transposase